MNLSELYEITGSAHIHSTYSDGTWNIPEIAQTADDVGLDFLLFSDHQTLQPKKDGLEGYYGKTLALIGYETSDLKDINHYLIFQLNDVVKGLSPAEYVPEVARQNGLGFIAHPMEKRYKLVEYPPYPWNDWNAGDYDGIEIWNQLSEWMDGLTKWNKLYRFIHPLHSTNSPPREALEKWDQAALRRKIIGISGIDAHSFEVKILNLFKVKVFHYKVMLKSLRNHLLLKEPFPRDDFKKAEKLVFDTLRDARLFFSNHRRGDARGFRFWAESGGITVQMGESLNSRKAVFRVKSPQTTELSLFNSGKLILKTLGDYLECESDEPGVYRVEARRSGHPWIFSNHIYFRTADINIT